MLQRRLNFTVVLHVNHSAIAINNSIIEELLVFLTINAF